MAIVIDPAGQEIRALQKVTNWKGKSVLEIGCGDGRLTLRMAAFGPGNIEAIDPDTQRIRLARKNLPQRYRQRITYHIGQVEKLKYRGDQFDIVLFSWSL